MTMIKICGVKSLEIATQAADFGAEYIGIVMHKHSKRYVNPERTQEMAKAIYETGAIPVAVFYDESAEHILDAIKSTGITTIQTYASIKLPENLSVIYSNSEKKEAPRANDYLLFDGPLPGSGELFEPGNLPDLLPGNFFIAGGLNEDNVIDIIKAYKPIGVDVSSGVETSGNKDVNKIKTFIQKVRSHDKAIRQVRWDVYP